jgi:CheY-like chemotaxis protein
MNQSRAVILVVDDEPLVRNLVRTILEQAGYLVLDACNGEEALTILTDYQGKINLLVTDINMPVMDGLELVHRQKSQCPGVKCLIMSGKDSSEMKAASENIPFLSKPFKVSHLLERVTNILSDKD